MPKYNLTDDGMENHKIQGAGNFSFSATKIDKLGASGYTLATIAVDTTGSTAGFASALKEMLRLAVQGIKKAPTSDSILVRVFEFNSQVLGNIRELHGFKPVMEIDESAYPDFRPNGSTPLCDAAFSALAATNMYAKQLKASDYLCNGILYVITDGEENCSKATMGMIKAEQERIRKSEELESLTSILIGLGDDATAMSYLDKFNIEAGFTSFLKAGDATPAKLAKVGGFISKSVSSTSQAVGTGGPSQQIPVTI